MKKKNWMLFTLFILSCLFLAMPAFSNATTFAPPTYTWKFILPSDALYDYCTVVFHADGNNLKSNEIRVNKGASGTWSSVKPLSYIIGWCGAPGYALVPRSCSGTDSKGGTGSIVGAKCAASVTVKVCPKAAYPNPYNSLSFGFCTE